MFKMLSIYAKNIIEHIFDGHPEYINRLKEENISFNQLYDNNRLILEVAIDKSVPKEIIFGLVEAGAKLSTYKGGKKNGTPVYFSLFQKIKDALVDISSINYMMKDVDSKRSSEAYIKAIESIEMLINLIPYGLNPAILDCNGENSLHKIARLARTATEDEFNTVYRYNNGNRTDKLVDDDKHDIFNKLLHLFEVFSNANKNSINKENNRGCTPLHIFYHNTIKSIDFKNINDKIRKYVIEFSILNIKLGFDNYDGLEDHLNKRFLSNPKQIENRDNILELFSLSKDKIEVEKIVSENKKNKQESLKL